MWECGACSGDADACALTWERPRTGLGQEKGSQLEPKGRTNRRRIPQYKQNIKKGSTTVVNLSSKVLNNSELQALEKGLAFVPTPKLDVFKLRIELAEFFHKIRLRTFFLQNPEPNTEREKNTGLRPESKFTPTSHLMPPEVLAFEKSVSRKIGNLQNTQREIFHNISIEELTALQNLSNDPSITIKPADKGGAIVIMPTAMYNAECLRLLNNDHH
ncbi:hypothetical protein NDU88_010431 [Pleurodeles waltl]|uniref:Uncharacterized protein n=1 Tax=Pleurodeles waltl TaxID=8319 RepID=A0AAV7RY76_PLEWA|nr:hypothetical protein NDU88_010431 [Pleurodeles waltl]